MRYTGTVVRGIRTPIIKNGDDLVDVVVSSILRAAKKEKFELENRDVVGITEAVVSICQSNYVTVDEVDEDNYDILALSVLGEEDLYDATAPVTVYDVNKDRCCLSNT